MQKNRDVKTGSWVDSVGGDVVIGAYIFDPPTGSLRPQDFHMLDACSRDNAWTLDEEVEVVRQAFFLAIFSSYGSKAMSSALTAAGEDTLVVHEIIWAKVRSTLSAQPEVFVVKASKVLTWC